MIKEEYLYVMDFSDSTISRINVTDEEDDDCERILASYGFNLDCCAYMWSSELITEVKEITEKV